jgi:hypothetical protein
MWTVAESAFGYLCLALTVMVALGGASCTYSILAAQECLVTEPLAVIALFRSSDLLEYTRICRYTCDEKVCNSLLVSLFLVMYTTMDPYVLGLTFRLS